MNKPQEINGQIETEVITADDDEITVTINYESTVYTEADYGANIDGEKGTKVSELDEVRIEVFWCGLNISHFLQKFMPQKYADLVEEAGDHALDVARHSE